MSDTSETGGITQRRAAAILQEYGLPRRAATRVLNAGLAGDSVRTGAILRYDEARVRALIDRPLVDVHDLPPGCHGGLLLARTTDPTDPLGVALSHARFSVYTWIALRQTLRRQGWYPLVVTLSHFVVAGAEILDGRGDHEDRTAGSAPRWTLQTRPPGSWFDDHFAGRMLIRGAGRAYQLWRCPQLPSSADWSGKARHHLDRAVNQT